VELLGYGPKMVSHDLPNWRDAFARQRKIISYVRSPLGFYVLALLIVETFLLGAGAAFNLSESLRIIAMVTGVILFVGVVATVTVLVIKYPTALVFSEQSHLEWESMQSYGDSSHPIDARVLQTKGGSKPPEIPEQPSNAPHKPSLKEGAE
jgi:hypothetical protein